MDHIKKAWKRLSNSVDKDIKAGEYGFLIDEYPLFDGEDFYISLTPQDGMLIFGVSEIRGVYTFVLKRSTDSEGHNMDVMVESDQLIIPMIGLANVDLDDAIVHFSHDGAFHLRIAATQLGRQWKIIDTRLRFWDNAHDHATWRVQISDQRNWSTSSS